jgi:hypothetical protein
MNAMQEQIERINEKLQVLLKNTSHLEGEGKRSRQPEWKEKMA